MYKTGYACLASIFRLWLSGIMAGLRTALALLLLLHFENVSTISALHGCETWALSLWEEHRLTVFEDSVVRIFGPNKDEVTGGWRKLV
jgi:hypothetical protein